MDILSDLFHDAGLRRRLLSLGRLPADAGLRFPCAKSIGFHIVTQGEAWVHAPDLAAPLRLTTGDVAVMARGCDHVIAPQASLDGLPVRMMSPSEEVVSGGEPQRPGSVRTVETDGAARLISGAYQLWNAPLHPFFAELPAWHVVRGEQMPRLGSRSLVVALLGQEVGHQEPGARLVMHGLIDVLFTYLMRDLLDRHPAGTGFCSAQRDPSVRQAVELMHAACAHPWSLEQLARQVGLSRTVLAERFRRAMGDTPLNYLRTVRLQRAVRLLTETDHKLDDIAAGVGYQDAFGFSKAFKRQMGMAPSAYRERDALERGSPWRFASADSPAGRVMG